MNRNKIYGSADVQRAATIPKDMRSALGHASGIELTRVLHAFYHGGEVDATAEMKALAFWPWQYSFVIDMCKAAEKTGIMRVFDKGVSEWVYNCFLKGEQL